MAQTTTAAPPRVATSSNDYWWVTASIMLGAFIVIVDGMIVNIALPEIMSSFGVDVLKIRWVATSYMLASAVMMPATGWLGQRFGNKNLYLLSLAVFVITSVFCGAAWSVDALIFFRIFQGVAGGVLMPLSMVIIFAVFPEEKRGLGISLWGLGGLVWASYWADTRRLSHRVAELAVYFLYQFTSWSDCLAERMGAGAAIASRSAVAF